MAEFNPFAGSVPNWEAVFVHTAHCAEADCTARINIKNTIAAIHFFIQKLLAKLPYETLFQPALLNESFKKRTFPRISLAWRMQNISFFSHFIR